MDELTFETQVEYNFKHNSIFNFLDGTFFWAGSSFITASTILPLYVSHFTDSKLLVGLISAIATGGWMLPQLFTAHRIEKMPLKKVVPVNWGFLLERLPVILLAITAWLFAEDSPALALFFFYLTFSWHTVGAGIVAVGWQDMIAKIIPRDRRGRFFGVTNFMGTATGMLGAAGAAWLLNNYDFPTGYVVSFGAAATLIFLSWVAIAQTREPVQEITKPEKSQREFWLGLPVVLRVDYNFRRFLISRIVITFSGMASGFLAVYAVQRWGLDDSQAGLYTTAWLLGQAIFNLLFGVISDRRGHKLVMELSVLSAAIAVALALIAPDPGWFYLVFILVGGSVAGYILAGISITFEFSQPQDRPTYIGLNNTINGVAYVIAPLLGALIAEYVGYRWLFGVALVIGLFGFAMMHFWVREPRDFSK
jgi:MFS family permease